LSKVATVKFLGWAYEKELVKPENLIKPKNARPPFYSLSPPPHSMVEFEEKFNIKQDLI
jgi:hypothetical protein